MIILSFPSAVAQDQPELGSWELSIEYIGDDPNIPFQISEDGRVGIQYYVNNTQPFSIEVSIEYDTPFDGESDGPESLSIPASSTQKIIMEVNGIDVFNYTAESKAAIKITATLVSREGVPAIIPESQEKSADLKIPTIYSLKVSIDDPIGPMNAGTEMALRVTVMNLGNVKDRVGDLDLSDNCPLMTLDNGLDKLLTTEINMNGQIEEDFIISASESHPQKNCKIEVTIFSQGAMNAGSSKISEDETTVTVEPPLSRPGTDDEGAEEPENPIEVVSSNLPAPGIGILFLAILSSIAFVNYRDN